MVKNMVTQRITQSQKNEKNFMGKNERLLLMKLKFYIWLMGVTGSISAWAWRKQAKIIRSKR